MSREYPRARVTGGPGGEAGSESEYRGEGGPGREWVALERAGEAVDEVYAACARLRFAEGLRRRWPEARAEAAIQEASHLAFLEGVRMPLSQLRDLVSAPGVDAAEPAAAQALGLWAAAWDLQRSLPALNSREAPPGNPAPAPAVLADINRAASTYLVAAGLVSSRQVGFPANPGVLAEVVALSRQDDRPAIVRAALAWRLIASNRLFPVAPHATAAIFAKWMLAREGVEPTGVAVLSRWPARNRSAYGHLVADAGADDAAWARFLSQSLREGCAAGEQIALSVQAGRYPPAD